MRLKSIQNKFHEDLNGLYPPEEVDSFFYMLIKSYYNVSRIELALDYKISINNFDVILNALQLLKEHKPIQYILGETEFYGFPIKVNECTLIPRPETEQLVDWVINSFSLIINHKVTILDIGTGSGCIAISLAKKIKNAKLYALDVSKDALKVAKQNANINEVDIEFIEADILNIDNYGLDLKFDVIVSNPPYVRDLEKKLMKPNVLNNEPHLALFVENEKPLKFYKAIASFAAKNLNKGGLLFFEINEYFGNEMKKLLRDSNFKNVELMEDIYKKQRMIRGVFN